MTNLAPPADAPMPHSQGLGELLFYSIVMAVMIGCCGLLFAELTTFSASLDMLTSSSPSEMFIALSRLAASIIVLLLLKDALVALLAFRQISMRFGSIEPTVERSTPAPFVSVIVPAYNESSAIEDTLESLIGLDYCNFEILVVDDGSTDDTLAKARRVAHRSSHVRVTVLSQPNSGKWSALNEGIAQSRGELVLCVDADSYLRPDALRLMVPHFSNPDVAAVSGQVQVRNKSTLIARLQALEYLVANGSARTAQSGEGCVLIVPGPVGLFRRSALDEVRRAFFAEEGGAGISIGKGPFSPHTFAEDFELSVMICALGGRIVYEPKAKALTRVPETTRALLSQRYRWLRGSMQVGSRYRREKWASKGSNKPLRRWMALTTIGDLYIVPLAGLLLLTMVIWTMTLADLQSMLTLWLLVWAIHACAAVMFIRSHDEDLSLSLLSPVQSLYAVVLLSGVWTHALLDHATGREMKW